MEAVKESPNPIQHLKDPVDPAKLAHRELLSGEFWKKIPAYHDISEEQFLDHKWQAKNSITKISKLLATLQGIVPK